MTKNPFEGLDRNNPADVLKAAEMAGITRYELRKMSPMMNDYLDGNNGQSGKQEGQPGIISDLWSSFGVGAGNLVSAAGSLYGLATGDMDNGATRLGEQVSDYWNKEKSNVLTELEQGRRDAINSSDSEFGKFGNAIWETVSNPRLLASFVSEQIPMFAVPGGAGAAGAKAGTAYAAKKGTELAAKKFGSKVGVAAGVGTGAAMQGGDVGANTYEELIKLPEPVWEQNPEYLQLKDELGSAEAAKEQIALSYGRKASAIAGTLSIGSQFIPGGATIEKAMAGNKFTGGLMGRVAKGFAGEGAQEVIEEGGGKVISNSFIDNIDENQGLFEGVGESSGLGLLGGGVMGGTMAAISGAPNIESTKQQYEAKLNQLRESGKKAVAEGDTAAAQQIDNDFKQTQAAYTEFLKEYDPGFVSTNLNKQQQAKADKAAQGGDALDQELAAAQAASTIADDVAKDSQVKMEAKQGLMGGMNVWQPNFTMPGSEQEQSQQVDGEYIANTDYPTSVPLGNNLGFDESVGAIDAMPENRVGQSDTIFTGEQREELPAPERLGLPDKFTNVIQGQDRTAELDAQEQMRQAQNAPRQIEQKDIIFGEDNRFNQGTERATVRSNGNPFPTVKSTQASRSYRQAIEDGLNPEIVKIGNGFGWETSDDIEAVEAPQIEAPTVEPSQEIAQPTIQEDAQQRTTSLLDTGRIGQSERPTKAITPQGREVGVEYRVVDASQVINSNDENGTANPDFPQEYQNRNRSRSASTQQIRNIANKLNPEQVDYGNMSTDGAPIVSPDGIVESGNGRVAGIKLAYKQGKANAYREYLEAQGYDTEGLQEPVLVRVRTTDMTPEERRQFVTESNERTTLSLSATEKAKDDASIISRIATDFTGGDIDSVANAGFVRKFMQGISSTEAAELTDAEGRLSQTGKRRIEAALLFNAYGDERVVTDLFESSDNDIKSIGGAMLDNAGQWAKMRQQAPTELDMTNNVIEAVNLVKQARREGRNVAELVSQQDIFSGEIPAQTERALKMMYGPDLKRAVSRKALSEKLAQYATLASNVNPEPGLFGEEVDSVTSNDLMDQINGTESTAQDNQSDLFNVEDNIGGRTQGESPSGNDTLTEDNQSLREPESQEVATQEPPESGFFTPDESANKALNVEFEVDNFTTTKTGRVKDGLDIVIKDLEGNIIGAVQSEKMSDGSLQVFNASLDEGQRGKGIGLGAYKKLISEARASGVKVITSDNSVSDSAASIWEKLGAKKMSENTETLTRNDNGRSQIFSSKDEAVYSLNITPEESETVSEEEIESTAPINQEDWGEEIKTARKNISVKWSENSTDDEISSKPLSKTWPENEFDDVGDPFASAFAYAARSEIPRKPNQSYKKQRWVEKVKSYRQLVKDNVVDGLLTGRITKEKIKELGGKKNLQDFFAKVDVLEALDRKDWGRIERVLSYPDADTPTTYVRINGRNREVTSTDPQIVAEQIKPFLEEAAAKPQMKFEVRVSGGNYLINKTGDPEYTTLATFGSSKEAWDFVKNQNSKLVESWESHKQRVNVTKADMRNKENKPRTGEDYRQGKEATAEDFQEKFGIKRGTFGKWVKQGKERQDMLNGTYDALMDLSNITGVPPKALSLEGKLGFAFGANGRGKAMAHYEPGEVVINLTKTKGAGSLAHEWFHALDNYFQKKRDTSPSTDKGHYITHNPETYYVGPGNYTVSESRFKNMRVADESKWRKVEGVRPEVAESFKNLVDTLNGLDFAKRSSRLDKGKANGYWSSNLEMAARAFESYVKAKMNANGYDNDFLANITSDTDFVRDDNRYPYIKADEIAEVEAAFDDLFNTIESKETESGDVALFSTPNNTNPTTTGNRAAISSTDANKVIDSIISSWTGGIKARRNEFVVAPTFDDLPSDIKDAAKQQGAEGKVYGVFHNGKTYVVLDKHNSTQELETTIFHETYGHYGMRKLFGNEITQKMNQLFVANGGISGLRKAAEKHGVDLSLYERGTEKAGMSPETRNRVLMEELLAHMQQDNKPSVKRMAKEVVGYIRQKLRDLGFAKLANVSDSDLFYILKQSRDAVRKGSVKGGDANILMRTQNNTDLDMSDEARMQRARDMGFDTDTVYYHGTKSSFDSFSKDTFNTNEDRGDYLGEAFYFSPSPKMASDYATWNEDEGANVIPVYLKMENPLIINGFNDYLEKLDEKGVSYSELRGMSNAEKASKIKSLGYDGLVDKQYGQVAVFEPEQIRSTNAAFDPKEEEIGNIMFRTMDDSAPQSFTAPIEKKWSKDWFKRKLQDKFAPIADMQASIEKVNGQELPEDQNTYRAEELFYGKTENDLVKMEENHVKPLVDAMTQNNIESGELDQYLIAKHARERNAHIASINPEMPDGGSGMTNAEADEILSRYEQEGKLAGLSIAANEVYKITEKRRELLRESGLEDEALLDVWDANYQFYVPLKGYADDSEGKTIAKTGKGFDIRGKESMRAMGRRTIAESPTAHAIQDLSETIIRSRKNEVGKTFLKMVEANPNPEIWEVFTDENPDTFRHNIDGEVRSRATHPEDGRLKNQDLMKMRGEKKDDYFAVKVDGKTKYIKLKDKDGLLMEAMKNMGPAQVNGFTKAMGAATRWLSMVNTSLNPEFTITNFTRDIQTALFNALAEQDLTDGKVKDKQIAGSMVKGTGKAVGALYKHARGKLDQNDPMHTWIEEFLADGAKTGYFDSKDVDQIGKDMSDLLDMTKGTNKGKILKAKKKVFDFVENINGSIENGVRLSAYIEARRAGVSRNKAASFAKNLTVNFNRKGEAGTFLNSVYMFFNAAVQGNVNFARAILTPKVDEVTGKKSLNKAQKIAAGIVGASFGWAALMREIGGEDEDGVPYWDKIPKGVRERSFVILKPGTDGEYFKIPLPYGYNIFYNIGDAMEAAVQSDTRTKGDLAAELALSAYASFIPLGSPVGDNEAESAALVATPTLFKPIVEIATNKNFFGGQIYRENMPYGPELRDSQMSMRSTGEMYKGIARWMNDVMGDGMKYKVDGEAPLYDISPDTIEHIVEFGLGGLYRFGSRMLDTAGTVASGGELDVTTTPFIRQVNGEIRPYEDISNFYDARQELKNIEAELKSRKGKARMEFMQEYRDKYRLRGLMSSIDKRMKLLRKQRDRIEIDDSLSFVEREERLQRIEDKMKSAVATFNQKWNETE